ncbi:MAG: AAA family ATPase, partial [Promethearchaeota archaeon]
LGKFMEENIVGGEIRLINDRKSGSSDIFYITDERKFPVHTTSSMVSELAAIDLFLKEIVRKGDLLIIEEPESHLHPGNIRKFARLLVKMIKSELFVIITTHSDILIHQINNFLKFASLSDKNLEKMGYNPDERLSADDVKVYYFKPCGEENQISTEAKCVEIGDDGIQENTLSKIIEELYDEAIRIQELEGLE